MTSYKTKFRSFSDRNAIKRKALGSSLFTWQQKPEQYCEYRLDGKPTAGSGWVRLKQYTNGTFYLEGSDSAQFTRIMSELGLSGGSTASSGALAATGASATVASGWNMRFPSMGSDESGKGDYFGPLVVAGCLILPEQAEALKALGVKDCKALTNAAVMKLAEQTAELLGLNQLAVVELVPATYNQTYEHLKSQKQNLNHMLANAHASVLNALWQKNEAVLSAESQPLLTIVDQFSKAPLVPRAIPAELRKSLTLIEEPKAEQYLPVAAASLIARHRFLSTLKKLEEEAGVSLPPGAGPPTLKAARALVRDQGPEALRQVAKLHFKTTEQAIS